MSKRRILVTRPSPEGEKLCQALTAQGDDAIHLPTLAFAPPPQPEMMAQAIAQLGEQDWLIFVSPQAVRASIVAIRRQWPELPPTVKFAAVGEGTAAALKAAGYLTSVVPENGVWSSEGLLNLPALQTVNGNKIAIIRGVGGREHLEKILTARGAHVLPVIVYQRVLPQIDLQPYLDLLKKKQIDIIIATSGQGLQHLKMLFKEDDFKALSLIPLLVISERLKMLAHDLGFQTIWVARNASQAAISEILEQKRK